MRHNGGRRPEEILAEIDRTRGEMDRTLSAIEQRLTPGQLVDQGLDYLRQSGATEFVQNLGGAAKQNPLPVALAGIGIAWLMALGRQPAQHHSSVRERAGQVAETTREQWNRARGGVDYLVHEQPLVLGAIGLAIGAMLGGAAPRNLTEKAQQAVKEVAEKAGPTAAGPDIKGGW